MSNTLLIVGVSILLFAAAIAAMAIGVMFRRPCLRGSCGGAAIHNASGERLSCATCPNRKRQSSNRQPIEGQKS